MNRPGLYLRGNILQRRDAEEILKEYSHQLQWRLDGCDALLDVGSGCGSVLMDFIYPLMPKNFERIVASDISPNMINYAKDSYGQYDKCDFTVLDIATETDLPKHLQEQFDHVTSFYCLHWILNKRQAVRNIFKLLRSEGGDCFLVVLSEHPIYDAYKLLSKSKKWSVYMKDVDRYVRPMTYSHDPALEFYTHLEKEGFCDIQIETKNKVFVYEETSNFKENYKPVNPFLECIPHSLHDSYMDDLTDAVSSLGLRRKHPSKESDYIFTIPYKLIVAYAKKRPAN